MSFCRLIKPLICLKFGCLASFIKSKINDSAVVKIAPAAPKRFKATVRSYDL